MPNKRTLSLTPIHPFPARMAPHLILDSLPEANGAPLRVLDPMSGSGTTVVAARLLGHEAFGCDTDPLAVLLSRVWVSDINQIRITKVAKNIQRDAQSKYVLLKSNNAYPEAADSDTKKFLDFWFDEQRRRELTALACSISLVQKSGERNLLWCAFSRLIIAKSNGASLAKDLSHSRPHKVDKDTFESPIEHFVKSVESIIKKSPFLERTSFKPPARIRLADARKIPYNDSFFDIVITSPPYLNAIDYIRCNKFSLVWMGYSVNDLSTLRSTNIGAERVFNSSASNTLQSVINECCNVSKLSKRNIGILLRYAHDTATLLKSISKVIKVGGKCKIVIGDCTMKDVEIRNSNLFMIFAKKFGFDEISFTHRAIPPNRRYLPTPIRSISAGSLSRRLHEEVVIDMTLNEKMQKVHF